MNTVHLSGLDPAPEGPWNTERTKEGLEAGESVQVQVQVPVLTACCRERLLPCRGRFAMSPPSIQTYHNAKDVSFFHPHLGSTCRQVLVSILVNRNSSQCPLPPCKNLSLHCEHKHTQMKMSF